MILRRAFYREALGNTLGIGLLLVAILTVVGLTTLLGRAARGELAEDIVFAMLGWQTLKRLDLLLTLALYLGLLLTLNRWYRDSEMTVLAACGIGLWQWLRPVLTFAAAVAGLVAVGAFYFTPFAARQMEQLRLESANRFELNQLEPGVFNRLPGGNRVFYAAHIDPDDGGLEEVFVGSLDPNHQGVVVARRGRPYTDPASGARYLLLEAGSLYDGAPGEAGYRILRFESYLLRLKTPPPAAPPPPRSEALPTRVLAAAGDLEARLEWHWRLAKPAATLVLALFALALAYTDTRRGQFGNLFAAVLVYFIYSNLAVLAQTLVEKGQLSPALGVWWVHGLMLALALYLLARRAANRPLVPRVSFLRT
jgi:lipopolysaccharide export system permease protein